MRRCAYPMMGSAGNIGANRSHTFERAAMQLWRKLRVTPPIYLSGCVRACACGVADARYPKWYILIVQAKDPRRAEAGQMRFQQPGRVF
jgi:hypothetical protein